MILEIILKVVAHKSGNIPIRVTNNKTKADKREEWSGRKHEK
jgi:hypothetical protein